jgi:hypothetical protein
VTNAREFGQLTDLEVKSVNKYPNIRKIEERETHHTYTNYGAKRRHQNILQKREHEGYIVQ